MSQGDSGYKLYNHRVEAIARNGMPAARSIAVRAIAA